MGNAKKTTQKSAPRVLAELAVFISRADAEDARELCRCLDEMLDDQGDMFGTEGQNDPRGDRRE